jgi:F-type H+-transporting ATPase subunit delta
MNDSRLASRYARALFYLASDHGQIDTVRQDLGVLYKLLSDSPEFRWLMESPVIMSSRKSKMVEEMLSGSIRPVTLEFMKLLIRHRRENNLASTCRMFNELYKADQGLMDARIESAVPVGQAFLDDMKKRLEALSHRKIELVAETNENLIGGFILTLEDQQMDASVQSKLKKLRQDLRETKK